MWTELTGNHITMIYIDKSLNVCDDFLEKLPMAIQDTNAESKCD